MKRLYLFFFILMITQIVIVLIMNRETVPTITYFPLDQSLSIHQANSFIEGFPVKTEKTYGINWRGHSKSDQPFYLRQDVSLLFENGYLKDLMNQWETNTITLQWDSSFLNTEQALLETISFHHGEIHIDGQITSAQKMSADFLYIGLHNDEVIQFKNPISHFEYSMKKTINASINQTLQNHWLKLINFYKIPLDQYHLFPLTHLYKFNNQTLPNLTHNETQEVIGKLWEGFYKNYLTTTINFKFKNFMPLLLIDHKSTHIIILYELNGRYHQLIQNISLTKGKDNHISIMRQTQKQAN